MKNILYAVTIASLFQCRGALFAGLGVCADGEHRRGVLPLAFMEKYAQLPYFLQQRIEGQKGPRCTEGYGLDMPSLAIALVGHIGGWRGSIRFPTGAFDAVCVTNRGDLILEWQTEDGMLSYCRCPVAPSEATIPIFTVPFLDSSAVKKMDWEPTCDTAGLLIKTPISETGHSLYYYKIDQDQKYSASFIKGVALGVSREGFIPVTIPGKGEDTSAGYYKSQSNASVLLWGHNSGWTTNQMLCAGDEDLEGLDAEDIEATVTAHPRAPLVCIQGTMGTEGVYGPEPSGVLFKLDSLGQGECVFFWNQRKDRWGCPYSLFFDTQLPRWFTVFNDHREADDTMVTYLTCNELQAPCQQVWSLPYDVCSLTFYPATDVERKEGIACVAVQDGSITGGPSTRLLQLLKDGKVHTARELPLARRTLLSDDHSYVAALADPLEHDDKQQQAVWNIQVQHTRFGPTEVQSPLAYALIMELYAASAPLRGQREMGRRKVIFIVEDETDLFLGRWLYHAWLKVPGAVRSELLKQLPLKVFGGPRACWRVRKVFEARGHNIPIKEVVVYGLEAALSRRRVGSDNSSSSSSRLSSSSSSSSSSSGLSSRSDSSSSLLDAAVQV